MRNGLIVDDDGTRSWYQNDQLHRTDGPAIEWPDGTKVWYQNDQRHRTAGPAVEHADGTKLWYVEGTRYSFIEWLEETDYTEVEKTMMRLQYAH